MKLLPLKDAKSKIKREEEQLAISNETLGLQINKKAQELSRLRDTEDGEFLRLQASYGAELAALRADIAELEARRYASMHALETETKEERERLAVRLADCSVRETEIVSHETKNQSKEDWLRLQEEQYTNEWKALDQRKEKITTKEKETIAREIQVSSLENSLKQRSAEIHTEVTERLETLARVQLDIERQRQAIRVQETLLELREADILTAGEYLKNERLHLESQRSALAGAFEEARRKGILS